MMITNVKKVKRGVELEPHVGLVVTTRGQLVVTLESDKRMTLVINEPGSILMMKVLRVEKETTCRGVYIAFC